MRELLGSFVTVADEVGRLQRGGDAECQVFLGFCEEGHYGGRTQPTSTRQGIYALTPAGQFLASVNTQDPRRMAAMLRQALERWREIAAAEVPLPAEQIARLEGAARFEDRCPEDGLVLAVYARDLGREADARDWRQLAWNQDQAWFTRTEVESLLPPALEVGARHDVPSRLVERLACLHLVDCVRGQTPPYPRAAVVDAELRAEVVAVDGELVQIAFTGATRTEQKGRWIIRNRGEPEEHERGVQASLRGRARWNRASSRFEAFELVAVGERWGATQYNERDHDLGPSTIGFAFVLAPAGHPRIAPAFWWQYDLR